MIAFVNRYFAPDVSATSQILTGIASGLAVSGLQVHVVTSRLRYEDPGQPLPPEEMFDGVKVHRVWTTRFGRSNLVGRAFDYLSFYLAAAAKLLALLRRGDILVVKTDPPLLSVVGALCAKAKGARLVNWQQDVYPEVAVALGFRWLGGAIGAPLRLMRDWSLRRAATNVALGDLMAERLRGIAARVPVRVIHNWADGARVQPVPASGRGGRFIVGYSGNMGRAHEFETMLRACVRLKDEPAFAFAFTGGGQQQPVVERVIRENQLRNVELRSYVEDARLKESLAACDVHLVSLLPSVEGLIVPSKFYGIAAAGRPTIFVGDPDGEVARLLRRYEIGISVQPGDVSGLVSAIRSLRQDEAGRLAMGARARVAFEAEWDKPVALAKWQALLKDLG